LRRLNEQHKVYSVAGWRLKNGQSTEWVLILTKKKPNKRKHNSMIHINNHEIISAGHAAADLLTSINDNQIEMQNTIEAQALEIHKLKESDASEKEKVKDIVHQEVVDQLNDRSLPTESDVDNQIEERVMDIVDDRITSHLEDHDVSHQVEEVVEEKGYITEYEAEKIVEDAVEHLDITDQLDDEEVVRKGDIEDRIKTEVYDLFIKLLPLLGGELHEETVRSYKQRGVDEYLKAQKEKEEAEAEQKVSVQVD